MIIFVISNICIFLEPPADLFPKYKNTIGFYGITREDIPENFFEDAGKELKLDWCLGDYLKEKQPAVELIERIDDELFKEAIAAEARTKNMWDCCYSIFNTQVAMNARVSLLVEYELSANARMDDRDCMFLFLECRKRYFQALAENRSPRPGGPDLQARGRAWSQATRAMLDVFGIPPERMEVIAREGSQKWLSAKEAEAGHAPYTTLRSYPHTPWYSLVLPKPKQEKVFFEVR